VGGRGGCHVRGICCGGGWAVDQISRSDVLRSGLDKFLAQGECEAKEGVCVCATI